MSDPNTAGGGGAVYLDWIRDLTAAQDARKDKIEARGLAVISVSGALVTLLFGLATLATRTTSGYRLPADARGWLYVAVVLFAISALSAILTNLPLAYVMSPPGDWKWPSPTSIGRTARPKLSSESPLPV
jgi:hypothetical protein